MVTEKIPPGNICENQLHNLILIEGGRYPDVKEALEKWIEEYSELNMNLTFRLFKLAEGKYVIQADPKIENEIFCYLINFLKYPFDVFYEVNVQGWMHFNDPDMYKKTGVRHGTIVNVFIPEDDKEYDNVYLVTPNNKVFKFSFSDEVTETNSTREYFIPDFDISHLRQPELLYMKSSIPKERGAAEWELGLRFKFFSSLIVISYLLCYLILQKSIVIGIKTQNIIGFATWAWFLIDYKLFREKRFFLGAYILSFLIFVYGIYIKENYIIGRELKNLHLMSTHSPILILTIQLPLRYIFKYIFKREPVVDIPFPTMADHAYAILLGSSIFLAMFLSL